MRIFRSIGEITGGGNAVATVGNFDGVHLGHRAIFRKIKQEARERGGVSVVITFVPHPLKVLAPAKSPRLINTYEEKELLIGASGVDWLVCLPFTRDFASLGAEEFVRTVLVEKIGIRKLVIGYDYAFGRGREGNSVLLRELGKRYGFEVETLDPMGEDGTIYSSSAVRSAIEEGDVKDVVSLLGRHYSVAGRVVPGRNRGKGLGFPTANLQTEKELVPAEGVYAVKVRVGDALLDGACNIGKNPTFGDDALSIEVFLLDFSEDLYGREMRIYFIERIRGEKAFPDAAALVAAISADVEKCREILALTPLREYREYLEEG